MLFISYTGLFIANSMAFLASAALILSTLLPATQKPYRLGSVWDEISVRVAYTVKFYENNGAELGQVKLEGGKQVKVPVGSAKQAEQGLRDALADTFDALARSDVFEQILGRRRP